MRNSVLLPLDLIMYRPEPLTMGWREGERDSAQGSADMKGAAHLPCMVLPLQKSSLPWHRGGYSEIANSDGTRSSSYLLGSRVGRRGESASNHSTYLLTFFVPVPRGDSGERGILAGQHTCVPLIPMLRLLVCHHLGWNYSKRARKSDTSL